MPTIVLQSFTEQFFYILATNALKIGKRGNYHLGRSLFLLVPIKKLREYATKDNVNFGENDLDVMNNEWDKTELADWGVEFAPEKPVDVYVRE